MNTLLETHNSVIWTEVGRLAFDITMKIRVNRKAFKEAVLNNPAHYDHSFTMGINEHGTIVSDSRSISWAPEGEYFFPIPAWDPVRSSRVIEEFEKFTESLESPNFSDWCEDNDGDIEDYLEQFPDEREWWEEWIDNQVEFMIDNYPSPDDFDPDMGLPEFEVVWEDE